MTYMFDFVVLSLILLTSSITAVLKLDPGGKKKKIIVFLIVFSLFASTSIIDTGLIFLSYTGIYSLPTEDGYISEYYINPKAGAASSLVFNGDKYDTSREVITNRDFFTDKLYTIEYSPLTRTITSIYE